LQEEYVCAVVGTSREEKVSAASTEPVTVVCIVYKRKRLNAGTMQEARAAEDAEEDW
jgi:hypothetical protein